MDNRLRVGIIGKAQGIKGEVRVHATTDSLDRLLDLNWVYCVGKRNETRLNITGARIQKDFVIMRFKEITDRNAAELLNGSELYIDRENAAPLSENEYYVGDIIGCKVITDDDRELGELTDIYYTGANDVYIVSNGGKKLMIPAIKDCILSVDTEKKIMKVHMLPGLEDL